MSTPFRVAVIGSGTSGLAAAVKLARSENNIAITLLESRREAGGRTRSFIDPQTGDTIDNGQHILMGCYHSTLEYLRTIASEHLLTWQNSLEIPFAQTSIVDRRLSIVEMEKTIDHRLSTIDTLRVPAHYPVPLNLLVGLLRNDLLHKYEKFAAARFGMGIMMFRYDRHSVHLSCADLFRHAHQPVTLIKKLWEPLVVGTINLPIEQASAQVFLHIMRIIFLQSRKNSRMLFPKTGLSDLFVAPALRFLSDKNCEIKYGQHIHSIVPGNNLIFVETEEGRGVFDALIYAGHYHDIGFMPEEIRTTIPTITYSPIVNAYLWTDRKILDRPICGFIGATLEWAFTKPTRDAAELIACTKSAALKLAEKENSEIAEIFWNDIKRAFPSDAKLLRSVVIKEKRATPVLNAELQLLRPKMRTSIPNIYLAGDLVQNGLPMTIEGAIRNGQKAADAILKNF